MHLPQELEKHLPKNAFEIIKAYWKKYPFQLRLSNHRQSRSGDYRYLPQSKTHLISINKSLNENQFLFTLVHEIAHQWVRICYKRRQSPHGKAWKEMFKKLLDPFVQMKVFPESIHIEVIRHMKNPKASTSADHNLYNAMQDDGNLVFLKDIEEGCEFKIGKKWYIKGPKRRTRYLCYSIPDKRKYSISSIASIGLSDTQPS